MKNRTFRLFPLSMVALLAVMGVLCFSCNPTDKVDSSPALRLGFSADTVLFDTVFTGVGSSTRTLMVYNPGHERVVISDVHLSDPASPFQINVDGEPGPAVSNVSLAAHDSLFVFVRININPNDQNAPFVLQDSLIFNLNGHRQSVALVAWGQNAHYIVADTRQTGLPPYKIIAGKHQTVTWKADKPYVIYGYGVVDSTAQLIIEAGCKIFFHKASGLWVYKEGTLKVNGTFDQRVVFQGDRTEHYFSDIPGQWDRIWINEGSTDNQINWAVIQNGFAGIQAETLGAKGSGRLIIQNTRILNMSGYGLLAKNYAIRAGNLLVYDAGIQALYLSAGGDYDFRHCTFADYWNQSVRNDPAVRISNFYPTTDAAGHPITLKNDLTQAYFGNCQIIGNKSEELQLDQDPTAGQFNYHFDHSAVQTQLTTDLNHFNGFVRLQGGFYRLPVDSVIPAVRNIGSMENILSAPSPIILTKDLMGRDRTLDGKPDAGALEFVPPSKSKSIF